MWSSFLDYGLHFWAEDQQFFSHITIYTITTSSYWNRVIISIPLNATRPKRKQNHACNSSRTIRYPYNLRYKSTSNSKYQKPFYPYILIPKKNYIEVLNCEI